ncbi:MAG: YARHG domain-containing protein [Treponema sp.]|nr:YARHG domain-containing protein [Candidatus Treponema caballi]
MKKILFSVLFLFSSLLIFAQQVELLLKTDEVYEKPRQKEYCESWWGPSGLYVDEVKDEINIINAILKKRFGIQNGSISEVEQITDCFNEVYYKFGEYSIGASSNCSLVIRKDDSNIASVKTGTGISFILKKDNGYIVYYVDPNGLPGAVDTDGQFYTNNQAMQFLKKYDSEKYQESLCRANEIGLQKPFLNNEVLIWGQTYYSTIHMIEKLWKPGSYLYPGYIQVQYDLQGNGYQIRFSNNNSKLVAVSQNGKWIFEPFLLDSYSIQLLSEDFPSTLWYVGFGGNIYYYVAGSDYTEVFRIRRTWGEPDFYAMAINGYTDDDYGAYVNEVLAGLSKADLRLLRNTVFALYGYHFNSADLASYFDRQVWYNDEGRTTADITLPEHRAKLVEMIQALEAE